MKISNIAVYNALETLESINKRLALSRQSLATGRRITKAADDPAGLTLATRQQRRIETSQVALESIGDAKNMLSIADTGLQRIQDILMSMRSKAESAASDTLGSDERTAIANELVQSVEEIDDIVAQTTWNGKKLLDGLFDFDDQRVTLQTGADPGDTTVLDFLQDNFGSIKVRGGALASLATFTTSTIPDVNITPVPDGNQYVSIGIPDVFDWQIYERDRTGGTTVNASVNDASTPGNQDSYDPDLASAGANRYIAFESQSSNLVAGDSNGYTDIFVRDRVANTTERVSVATGGAQADRSSYNPELSDDGQLVVFESSAENLVGGDSNEDNDIFVHNRTTGVTSRVSVASDGTQANNHSGDAQISGDGSTIIFRSYATNLVNGDTNGLNDIFVHTLASGITERVSVNGSGEQANQSSNNARISDDGRYVVFDSTATNLVAGDSNNTSDIFLRDRVAGTTIRVSVDSLGAEANGGSYNAGISGDGQFIVFESAATNLVAGDANNRTDIFVYDRTTGVTQRVSVDGIGGEANNSSYRADISDDGRYVTFYSDATNLVAGDTNQSADIFVYDRTLGTVERVSVDGSGSQSHIDSADPDISDDGRYVSFRSDLAAFDANKAPETGSGSIVTKINVGKAGTLRGADANDADSLIYTVMDDVDHGTLNYDANTGAFTYMPDLDYTGADSFTYKVNDGTADSNIATVSIDVRPDLPPEAGDGNLVTILNQAIGGSLTGGDPNGDPLTFAVVSLPTKGTLSVNSGTGAFVYTPTPGYVGADSFTYKVNDGAQDSNLATVSIQINDVDDTYQVDVSDHGKATAYMGYVDTAISTISQRQQTVGTLYNRLALKESRLAESIIAYQATYSRIMDTNMAQAQSESLRLEILQQSNLTMLHQMMNSSRNVLALFE